jgi:two-component system, LytTR family, response regulator
MKISEMMQSIPNIQDINFMFVVKGYTMADMKDGSHELIDLPLRLAERYLSNRSFFRIHKSYLINLHRIKELDIHENRITIPINGKDLPVSRRKKRQLFKIIGLAG